MQQGLIQQELPGKTVKLYQAGENFSPFLSQGYRFILTALKTKANRKASILVAAFVTPASTLQRWREGGRLELFGKLTMLS